MPPLPKQKRDFEAKFGLLFRSWWQKNKLLGSFELKYVRTGKSFPFSELHEEQIAIGLQTITTGCLIRVSSGTIGAADYYGLKNFPTWVVIKYPGKHFYIISLETLLLEKKRSKSLSEVRAEAIAVITV